MKTFAQLAADLSKPGAEIITSLTPESAHLLHMAIGVSGEIAELVEAIDRDNAIEEIGDILFYCEGYLNGIDRKTLKPIFPTSNNLVVEAGRLLDVTKKHVIYGKELNTNEAAGHIVNIMVMVDNEIRNWTANHDEVLAALNQKLSTRYASGKYSNKQAQDRVDK